MKILVISDLPQFVTGGAERQAANLIEAWMNTGHQVTCFGRRMRSGEVKIGRHALFVRRIHTVRKFGRLLRGISYFFFLTMLLLRYRHHFDVIYTRFLGEAAITVSLLKHLGFIGTPLIATPASTGGDGSDVRFLANLPFRARLIRALDKHCNTINLIVPAMIDELRTVGLSGKNFANIPNGVSVQAAPPTTQHRPHRFIVVGRIAREKGLDTLIEAIALIREKLQPGIIRVIGEGPEKNTLKTQAEQLGVAHAIEWLGELDHGSVLEALGQSQIFLLPSRYEGMSNAGLEAMERGLAMVLSRCDGLDAHIKTGMGWVVKPEDPGSLATALSEAIMASPPALASMGEQNRAYALQHFDIKLVATRYLELFTSLLKKESMKPAHDQRHHSRFP